jgi:hypothetical protein
VSKCLDVNNNNAAAPYLADPGGLNGQQWSLIPAGIGYFKLSNANTGSASVSFLGVYSGRANDAFMSKEDFHGQYWKEMQVG